MTSGSWSSSLLKCLTYTSTSVMVIKIYVKIIVFCTLLWNQKDKEADEWINDWGPLCNFFGRLVMQIPTAGFFLEAFKFLFQGIWTFPPFIYNFITEIPGSVTSIVYQGGRVLTFMDLDTIDRSILTPISSTMFLVFDWLVWRPLFWIWSFWSGCYSLLMWIYDLDNKWVVVILLGVIFFGDLCKASMVIQRLEQEQDMLEYKKEMKASKKKTLSPGANPKKLKKYRAKNGFPQIENKPSELLALENNSKKTNNKTNQKVTPAVKYQEKKGEKKIPEEVDDSCLEVCKMLINFCHDPKRKKEVIANIKKRGFADNDDIMKLINDVCNDKGEAENDERAKNLMDTIQKGKSKYYNQSEEEEEKPKKEKVYPAGIKTPIEKQFHDIYDDVQKLDKSKLAAIKLAKIYDNIEALDLETEDIKNDPEDNNNTLGKERVKKKTSDKSKEKKSTKKIDGKKVRICWKCDLESTELWKCGGCRKAWYCNDECLRSDWEHHGSFCNKMQEKRKKKNSAPHANVLDDDEMD